MNLTQNPKGLNDRLVAKNKAVFLQNYYNKKNSQMIINNENFNVGSKYRALAEIVSAENEIV